MASQYDDKQDQLDGVRKDPQNSHLTTQQGVKIDDTDDALTAGERGPTLLEDFHAREKITHFDHERIPEHVVHARRSRAYGHFQPYSGWLSDYTAARFLADPQEQTPVFVRFSTVQGSKGATDTVRDVRGFATKFYTSQGNYDLVGVAARGLVRAVRLGAGRSPGVGAGHQRRPGLSTPSTCWEIANRFRNGARPN